MSQNAGSIHYIPFHRRREGEPELDPKGTADGGHLVYGTVSDQALVLPSSKPSENIKIATGLLQQRKPSS
jgi:hypothetical protein